ncbi:PAS domain-containing protein, partial [bacterium]|nr:PAS domain-containing protein [bacterium]
MLTTMVEPEEKPRPPQRGSRFEEGLAYLLAFSDGLLELVPDGIGVLDDRLRVRSANRAFAEVFGFDSAEGIRGVPLRSEALFRIPIPDRPGVTLGLLLRNMLAAGGEDSLYFERLEVADGPGGKVRRWSARATMWDTEDPQFRRVLVWVHPWRERGEPTLPEDAALASRADRFDRLALDRRLFDHLSVCVVDASLRVQIASPGLEAMLGYTFDPEAPGDRHVFAVFPPLRAEEVRMVLDVARQTGQGGSTRIRLPANEHRPYARAIEIEVGILAPRDERASELLLLLHEVEDMASSPSTDTSRATRSVPETLAGMIANLEHWPPPASEQVLLVESDSWTRMLWADAMREAGVADIALCDSAADLWDKHEPASFGVIFLAVDDDPADVRELCNRLGQEAPDVPA